MISLLATLVVVSLNNARVKARDAARKSDLNRVRTALELYYDTNGSYPIIARWATSGITPYDPTGAKWAQLESALSMSISDPLEEGNSGPWSTNNFHYAYGSNAGQIYDLIAQLENTSDEDTCQNRCWTYHHGEGIYPPDTAWCNACPSGANWSPYLYADH